jgi:hypothetical protein
MRDKGLDVSFESKDNVIRIGLGGTCDMSSLPYLQPFLDDLHDEAARLGARRVILDVERLYFMNSASIKCFIVWIGKVNSLSPTERYTVAFRMNARLAWQQRSLSAIWRYAPEIVQLES